MGLWRTDGEMLVRAAESLADDADADPFQRVIGGIILAAAVAPAGIAHFAAAAGLPAAAWLFDFWHVRHSASLVSVGVLLLAVAIFLHAHYFWTPHPRWHEFGRTLKMLAAIVIVVLLLFAAVAGIGGWCEVPMFRRRGWR